MAKILIVDDTPDTLLLLGAIFGPTDHECIFATCGAEAVAAYDTARAVGKPFDVIVLDMNMPDMTGCQVAHQIQQVRGDRETQIVLLTAYKHEKSTMECAAEMGAEPLTKPDDVLCLPRKVDEMVEARAA